MKYDCYLLTETAFHATYLVTLWRKTFNKERNFKEILVREEKPSDDVLRKRNDFHRIHQGKKKFTKKEIVLLRELYPNLLKAEEAIIALFGIPEYSCTSSQQTHFLGTNLNNSYVKNWLQKMCQTAKQPPFFFIFIDQILAPWWITLMQGHIINAHPAVLPYARGVCAIENMAIAKNKQAFETAAGATIHYVDTGVDTGPIIQAQRLQNVFSYHSLWEVKAYSWMTAMQLLTDVAKQINNYPITIPVGIYVDKTLVGSNFKSRDFTKEQKKKAAEGFLCMKETLQG